MSMILGSFAAKYLIPFLAILAVGLIRKYLPGLPKAVLPVLAAASGAGLGVGAESAGVPGAGMITGGVLGLAGSGLKDFWKALNGSFGKKAGKAG